MPAQRKISRKQQKILAEFMVSNLEFAHSPAVSKTARKKWQQLTTTLNAAGGEIKDTQGWKKYWGSWKHKVKARATAQRQVAEGNIELLHEIDEIVLRAIPGYLDFDIPANNKVTEPVEHNESSSNPSEHKVETFIDNIKEELSDSQSCDSYREKSISHNFMYQRSSQSERIDTTQGDERKTVNQTQTKPQSQSQTKPQSQSQTKPQCQSQTKPQSQSQTKPQCQSQTKPQSQSQTKPQSQSQTKPQCQSQTKPQSQSQTKPQSQSQTKPQSQYQTEPISDDWLRQVETRQAVAMETIAQGVTEISQTLQQLLEVAKELVARYPAASSSS